MHLKKIGIIIYFLFSFFYLLAPARKVLASDFTTDYNVTYEINEEGKALITQQITLTNNTHNLYPSEYTLSAQESHLKNIHAANSRTGQDLQVKLDLETNPEKESSTTKISVQFDEIAVGLGSQLSWTLSYEAESIAQKFGQIWEITIPRMEKTEDLGKYNLSVRLPKSFGPENYVSPLSTSTEDEKQFWLYHFSQDSSTLNKPSFSQGPITMAFGDYQLFDFKLKYHLQNPLPSSATTEIALPPDFAPYQKIYLKKLTPAPVGIQTDPDGNYLALYELDPNQEIMVTFEGQALVKNFTLDKLKNQSLATEATVNNHRYKLPAKYWEVNNEKIKVEKSKIQNDYGLTEQSPPLDWARAIYTFVTQNLTYNSDRINDEISRMGAVQALEEKDNAVCMEFTDLLITLMRAAGIPARELDGYAFTEDNENKPTVSDVLHSWVQIYLPESGWVNIDPTWGSTTQIDFFNKLDTNHFIFVIKGLDSEKPYPAGSYKIDPEEKGAVQVTFSENFEPGIIPFKLWRQNWEMKNQKVSLIDKIFRWLIEFF